MVKTRKRSTFNSRAAVKRILAANRETTVHLEVKPTLALVDLLRSPLIGHNGGPKLDVKDTNPKDAVGTKKWRVFTTAPMTIFAELGIAMLEGARKYGRHNYRVAGVRGSVYIDAAIGHIVQWWEGENIDADSKRSHIIKAIASLAVLYDAMLQGKFLDDRPPKTNLDAFRADLQAAVDDIFERIPEAKPAYVEGDQYPKAEPIHVTTCPPQHKRR